MSDQDKEMFLYVAAYDDEAAASKDFQLLKDLHSEGWVGTYDAGVVVKDQDGKMNVSRHTDSTGKGTRRGLVVGAVLGVVFPPSVLVAGAVGAGAGNLIGRSLNDISKDDLKSLGELLENNQSAVVVIGESKVEEMVAEGLKNAVKEYKKEFNADVGEYNKALDELVKEI